MTQQYSKRLIEVDLPIARISAHARREPEIHSINAFAYTKLPWTYLGVPIFDAPHWLLAAGYARPTVRQPNYPIQRAFRTAGLVRGPHPYALVVDDIRKDAAIHRYDWILTLEPDISIVKTERHGGQLDVLLRGDSSPALLLVRVLHRTTSSDKDAEPLVDELETSPSTRLYGITWPLPLQARRYASISTARRYGPAAEPHVRGVPYGCGIRAERRASHSVVSPRPAARTLSDRPYGEDRYTGRLA